MPAYVALLRGVNVGGKNMLPMKDLAGLFEQAGCSSVRTYIQSGNVVFQTTQANAGKLPATIAKGIADRFGFRAPVVLRSAQEIGETVRHNPFLPAPAGEEFLHVMFLADHPAAERVASLDPDRSPPDAYVVRGRDIYLRCPNGAGKTKLTNAYFDSKLATISTGRNWRTVLKVLELLS